MRIEKQISTKTLLGAGQGLDQRGSQERDKEGFRKQNREVAETHLLELLLVEQSGGSRDTKEQPHGSLELAKNTKERDPTTSIKRRRRVSEQKKMKRKKARAKDGYHSLHCRQQM